jgi:Ni,Fe-hydrogenase III component G
MRSENGMTWEEIKTNIREKFQDKILNWQEHNDRRIYIDIDPGDLVEISRHLFEELQARFIIASGVDTPRDGIEILYHFDFFQMPQVVSLRVFVEKKNLEIESLAPYIKGTEWIEREIAELLGITFKNHPNPIHLILPSDWPEGNYPLRRDQ